MNLQKIGKTLVHEAETHLRWCVGILASSGAIAISAVTYLVVRFGFQVKHISAYFGAVVLALAIFNLIAYHKCYRSGQGSRRK